MSVCMSAVSAGISEVLIKYTGKYVNIYFIMKITFHVHIPCRFLVLWTNAKLRIQILDMW